MVVIIYELVSSYLNLHGVCVRPSDIQKERGEENLFCQKHTPPVPLHHTSCSSSSLLSLLELLSVSSLSSCRLILAVMTSISISQFDLCCLFIQ